MSADLLRRVAALIRERAEAASRGTWQALEPNGARPEEPWDVLHDASWNVMHDLRGDGSWFNVCGPLDKRDAIHIASWRPTVTLSVADWLDEVAAAIDGAFAPAAFIEYDANAHHALTVARAYLGETS